jgi:hypothetical protein
MPGKDIAPDCCSGWNVAIPEDTVRAGYCTELATVEKALLALEPTRRIVPTTSTRITASITAYSAMSCPWSSNHILLINSLIQPPAPNSFDEQLILKHGGSTVNAFAVDIERFFPALPGRR